LTPPENKPLRGRTVAVTRGQASGEDALTSGLRALGATVFPAPAVALSDPTSFEELDGALRALQDFEWVVFASANAVERTCDRMAALGIERGRLASRRLAAVGSATADRLGLLVRPPDLVPELARGEALAGALADRVGGRRVLVPRAEEGRPELVEGLVRAGALVTAPSAYRTVEASPALLEPLRAALEARSLDAVTFASPSAVRAVLAIPGVRAVLEGVLIAAIGPTTRAALESQGLAVAVVPQTPTGGALALALAARLGPR